MYLAQGYEHGDLGEDRTPTYRSGIRRSTTRPPRLLGDYLCYFKYVSMSKCTEKKCGVYVKTVIYIMGDVTSYVISDLFAIKATVGGMQFASQQQPGHENWSNLWSLRSAVFKLLAFLRGCKFDIFSRMRHETEIPSLYDLI